MQETRTFSCSVQRGLTSVFFNIAEISRNKYQKIKYRVNSVSEDLELMGSRLIKVIEELRYNRNEIWSMKNWLRRVQEYMEEESVINQCYSEIKVLHKSPCKSSAEVNSVIGKKQKNSSIITMPVIIYTPVMN